MDQAHCERLSALDAAFLELEAPGVHMHVGSVGIFDPGPLSLGEHGIDFERILELTDSGLHRAPRFRQKLSAVPLTGHPVWVDDEHFNIRYHVRHTALPDPGDERLLKRLAGRIMSQKLDRTKPMWELWFVEGLPERRIGVISKIHHCMIDGISGVDLLAAFMGPNADYRAERVTHHWRPRPEPSTASLLTDEVSHRVALPLRGAKAASSAVFHPVSAYEQVSRMARGFSEALGASLSPGSETPLNQPIGPHRRFDWTRFDLNAVKAVKNRLGGTVNDVILACVAGAVRDYLGHHHLALDDIEFKVFVPVSTRTKSQHGQLGNRVSSLMARLPVEQSDPALRMRRVIEETTRLKESDQAVGTEIIEELSDWTSTAVLTTFSRLAASQRSYNMVVTNVPGPQFPVFMEGAQMLACYPLVPLFSNQALGIALLSYDKSLFWGFNADWEKVPDLHQFVEAIEREFVVLQEL